MALEVHLNGTNDYDGLVVKLVTGSRAKGHSVRITLHSSSKRNPPLPAAQIECSANELRDALEVVLKQEVWHP